MNEARVEKVKTKKKGRWWKITLVVVFVLAAIGGVMVYRAYSSLKTTVKETYQPVEPTTYRPVEETKTLIEREKPFCILIMGVDKREGDKGRADTLIALTVNPTLNTTKMVSIPRDTRTEIVGHGTVDKINHSYAFGNEEMTVRTVEKFLNIPVDYYVKVNLDSFQDIVNTVGGVTVNNPFAFEEEGIQYSKGNITLDGREAMWYVRMRKGDPKGDFGRQNRQRQMIQAIASKLKNPSVLMNYQEIFDSLGKNVRTNLTFDQMKDIRSKYGVAIEGDNVEQISIKATGATIDGISYQLVSDEEKSNLSQLLRTHLELAQ